MKIKYLLLVLLVTIAVCTILVLLKHPDNTTYDVRVINGFTNNSSEPLIVWCTSDDKVDIGGRALQERDDYSWNVKSAGFFRMPPRFFCTVKWDGRRKKFEAFALSRDRYRCGAWRQCYWLVKEDGFYFGNDGVNWIQDFPWMS